MRGTTALARVMEQQGRRQEWLARQTGFSIIYINYLCRGRRAMSANAAARIGAVLGVLPDTLYDRQPALEEVPMT